MHARTPVALAVTALGLCVATPAVAAVAYVVCDPVTLQATVLTGSPSQHTVLAGPFPGPTTASIWIEESCPGPLCRCEDGSSSSDDGEPWMVVCNRNTHNIGLETEASEPVFAVMAGPFSSYDEAKDWVAASCPTWRCDEAGSCGERQALPPPDYRTVPDAAARSGSSYYGEQSTTAGAGGWAAGPVTTHPENSHSVSSQGWVAGEVRTGSTTAAPEGTGQPVIVGPRSARPDVTPLIEAAKLAVSSCSFRAALANADQLETIEPDHPWLHANHARLRQLASRQQTTEQLVWQASSQLEEGQLKAARRSTEDASTTAVSCQMPAVAGLLANIDEAIAHNRAAKDAARRRAAGQLLAGLLVLNQAATSEYSATGHVTGHSVGIAAVKGMSLALGGPEDPCTFQYAFSGRSTEPTCTCAGYTFDSGQLRCVRP